VKLLEEIAVACSPELETRLAQSRNSPLVLWHLMSLDAPAVAVVWTWFAARVTRTALPAATLIAMGLAVWVLYAADRLLDTRALDPIGDPGEFEARHFFHHRHRTAFALGIVAASVALALLLPRLAPDSIHLYLTEAALMAGYFLLIHATPRRAGRRHIALPKELMVGPFFAAATFIPTVARHPGTRLALLPDAVLFAALCCLNCLFIYAWEHPEPRAHWTTNRAIARLPLLASLSIAVSVALAVAHRAWWMYPAACAASGAALLLLDRMRSTFARPTLRAAADAALLTPLLFLLLLAR
jgi:hypothetical protein